MDLTKINKDNVDIVFYKHVENVVKNYDGYVYQKEQLMYLDIIHDLAVEKTIDIVNSIIDFNSYKNSITQQTIEDDYFKEYANADVNDFLIRKYESEPNGASIVIRDKNNIDECLIKIKQIEGSYYLGYYENDSAYSFTKTYNSRPSHHIIQTKNSTKEPVITIDDLIIKKYVKEDNKITIQLRAKHKDILYFYLGGIKIQIVEVKGRYKVYLMRNLSSTLHFNELTLDTPENIKKINYLPRNVNINNEYSLVVYGANNINSKKGKDILNIDNIKENNMKFDLLLDNLKHFKGNKDLIKKELEKYLTFDNDIKHDKFYNAGNIGKIGIGKTITQYSYMIYNTIIDADNIMAMLYDYMINNIDEFIKDEYLEYENLEGEYWKDRVLKDDYDNQGMSPIKTTSPNYIPSQYRLLENAVLLNYSLPKHFKILFDIIQLDIDMICNYNKTKDIKPIFINWLENLRNSDYTILEMSDTLKQVSANEGLNTMIKLGEYNNHNEAGSTIKFEVIILKNILNSLIDKKDNMFNLLTLVMLSDYNKYKDIKTIKISDDKEEQKVTLKRTSSMLFRKYLGSSIGNKSFVYGNKEWNKQHLDKLHEIINL